MNPEDEAFERISNRIAQATADSALLLIDHIVHALRTAGIDIDNMKELCSSVVSGQANDPAAAYALADFTHGFADALKVKKEKMQMMVEDDAHDQTSTDEG